MDDGVLIRRGFYLFMTGVSDFAVAMIVNQITLPMIL